MFWLLLLCHFIADYPLQTDGMVIAKKRFPGLFMHVFIHLVTLITLLFAIMKLETGVSLILALSVSILHFAIDHWKNILSRLRPSWVMFSYIQDQILHLLSLFLVSFFYSRYNSTEIFYIETPIIIYASGLILCTHFWFVTERVLFNKNSEYLQWINISMWPRMMSRGMFYGILFTNNNISSFVLFTGSIIVGWNDLKPEKRSVILARDLGGVLMIMCLTWFVGEQLL